MPFIEYMLLAILGSAPATGGTSASTFTADAVSQPSGGTAGDPMGLFGQKKPTTGKKPLEHSKTSRRHHRKFGSDYTEASRHHKGRHHAKVFKTTRNSAVK